jgi:hypothetical protein
MINKEVVLKLLGELKAENVWRSVADMQAENERLRTDNAKLRAALKEIMQVYVGAPGWASPEGDPQGLAWKMSDIARRALEEGSQ